MNGLIYATAVWSVAILVVIAVYENALAKANARTRAAREQARQAQGLAAARERGIAAARERHPAGREWTPTLADVIQIPRRGGGAA